MILPALVNYHLLNSVQCAEAITAGSVYETAEGSTVEIGCDGDSVTVNGIKMVLKKDIVASNGVIHLIDQVLIPDAGKTHFSSTINFRAKPIFWGCFMIDAAKETMELMGTSQTTFRDLVAQMGLAAAMGPKAEYTLLAPPNSAFTSKSGSGSSPFISDPAPDQNLHVNWTADWNKRY